MSVNHIRHDQGHRDAVAGGRTSAWRLSLSGVIALILMMPLGKAHSQTVPTESQAQFSFRSLPTLRADRGNAGRLVFLPPSAFNIPQELLWQRLVTDRGSQPTPALADAAQAIRAAIRQSLAALKAGDAARYVAMLAPDYEQSGPSGATRNKADVLRATQAALAGHRYAEADFEITDLRLTAPTEAAVTMTQRTVTVTTDTPPTVYKTPDGLSYVQSNTVTVHRVTVFHQTWAKRGANWVLVRSQAVDGVTTAVA